MTRAATRGAGLAALAVAAVLLGGQVPLYDGIGFPDEPYRYVSAPAGVKHGPPARSAEGTARSSGGTNVEELSVQTAEQGPQLLLSLPRSSVKAPAAARTVTLRAQPLAPDRQPSDGAVDGNVYRVSVTSDAGPVTFGPDVGQSFLFLRAASMRPAPPVMEWRPRPTAAWSRLQTGRGGADVALSAFRGAGDYALVHLRGARPVGGGGQHTLLLGLLVVLVAVIVAALVVIRRYAGDVEQP